MIKKLKSFSKFEFLYHTLYFVKIILKVIETTCKTACKVARSSKKNIFKLQANSSIMLDLLLGDTESEKRQFRLIGAHNVDSSRKH